jgi:hypothetical protein
MPKFSEGQVAIGLLALFAFWLFVVLPIMFAQSEYWTIAEHELKITDTLVAVFTALLFFATLLLFFATRALVLGAEKTAERQLRAYVFAQVDCLKRVDNDWRCDITIKNSGQTPAYKMTQKIRSEVLKDPTEKNFDFKATPPDESKSSMAPGGTITASVKIEPPDQLAKGEYLYVFGEIHYLDAFDKERHTKFRFYNDNTTPPGKMLVATLGNEED